ncbi:hypothetical protein MRX96_030963 [Rhipicephalus microplus]
MLRPAHRPRYGAHRPRLGPACARETCRGSWKGRGAASGKRSPCTPLWRRGAHGGTLYAYTAARLTHDRRMRRSGITLASCVCYATSDAYQRGGCAPRRAPLSPMRARVSFLTRGGAPAMRTGVALGGACPGAALPPAKGAHDLRFCSPAPSKLLCCCGSASGPGL